MSALVTSNCDLSDELNRTQARYELNRALGQADTQGLAAWARKWGEASLAVADCVENFGLSFRGGVQLQQITSDLLKAHSNLTGGTPDTQEALKAVASAHETTIALALELES